MSRFYLQMHITNKCNNRCSHCYQSDYGGEDMSVDSAKLIFKELSSICKKVSVRSEVSITGGSPVLADGFIEIVETARELCDVVRILGNLEGLSDEIVLFLKKVGVDGFQLSLDGSRQTHDSLRSSGSFDRTISAMKKLSSEGILVFVNSTLSDNNRHEISLINEIAEANGASHVSFEEYVPYGLDCSGKCNCSLGSATMAILPDLTIMACRRTPSSILGKWTKERGLFYHLAKNEKMIEYRRRKALKNA